MLLGLASGCGMQEATKEAGQKFNDQYFKTAIALIELHKLRFGSYPSHLDSLKYLGEWDQGIHAAVVYAPLDSGYTLDAKPMLPDQKIDLKFPPEFWKGLGLIRSNVKK